MTQPLLHVDGLNVTFNTSGGPLVAVRDFSLSMGREKIGIVGESGSGKSMTARAVLGLVREPGRVTARTLRLNETDLLSLSPHGWRALRGKKVSMILQDAKFSLNPVKRTGNQIEETLRLHERMSRRERRERALAILQAVGIDDPARVYQAFPHELSGGMGQRAMIAIMLVSSPDLLIADEPTSALDVIVREQVLRLLNTLVAERGLGLILISHDLPMVARFCDRILVMYRGRVVETLDAKNLGAASHPYTRGLLACLPSPVTRGQMLPTLSRDPAWEDA
ncbi:MAG TPA: ABC transporter ATP-binding protein [Microvirga sp.]|jgi:peptide/nickel transport system ATP-binding protein|nr:ABC transporter ATP-binding protein [Microvirga sp.]